MLNSFPLYFHTFYTIPQKNVTANSLEKNLNVPPDIIYGFYGL